MDEVCRKLEQGKKIYVQCNDEDDYDEGQLREEKKTKKKHGNDGNTH